MSPETAFPPRDVKRATRVLLVADVVESVRLVEQDEEGMVSRWLGLVEHIATHVLPACQGRLVKDLGDGVLLEFHTVLDAISAAFAIQHASHRQNLDVPPAGHVLLRVGIEVGDVIVEGQDLFGRGVILAQRFTTLAGPGETVVSAQVREQLTPGLDADVEDLGECFLKHVHHPVRAYRIGPPGPHLAAGPCISTDDLLPTMAVVPFATRDPAPEHQILGEVLAEEVIASLSRSSELNVISRLSTTVFRGRGIALEETGAHLNADYVVSGVYRVDDRRLTLDCELAETKSGRIVWTRRFQDRVDGVLAEGQGLIGQLVGDIAAAVLSRELRRARAQALPTLKNYTLLIAAVALMNRLSLHDFEDARHLLQTLLDRGKRQAIPQAWLAKWHVLRVQQGWSPDPKQDAGMALQCTRIALDADPECSLALAVDGFVHTNLLKRFDVARTRYDLAIEANPNDSMAWLLRGTMHAFMAEGRQAVEDTQRALILSPLDPHRYFYDSLAGTAYLAAGEYGCALDLAKRSLRANRTHTSTLRLMAVAQWRLGLEDEARGTVQDLLRLEPSLTMSRYRQRSPATPFATGEDWSDALRRAGVPE